jgi:hypothetical protein
MSYGFDQAFIKLNDLRMYIATVANVEEREKAISTLMDDPGLRVATAGNKHKVFRTVAEYLNRSNEFADTCRARFTLSTDEERSVYFGGRYAGASCMVVGSGEGFDENTVRKAQEKGAVIVALGNAIHLYQDADIWVGYRRPPAYVNEGFVSPKTLAIYPKEFKNEKLWHANGGSRTWSNIRVGECPNILFYSRDDAHKASPEKGLSSFLENPQISCLGIQSCLTIGLSFVAASGFRNIVLHGISFSEKYAFEEDVHVQTAKRKVQTYGSYQDVVHPALWVALSDRYISMWSTSDVPLPTLRFTSDEMLLDAIGYATSFSRARNSIVGISEPPESKVAAVEQQRKLQNTMLTGSLMGDKIDEILDKWPKRLKGKEPFEEAKRQMEETTAKGGCSGCARGRIFAPALRAFAEMAKKAEGKARSPINQLWKKVFPDNLNLMHENARIMHPSVQGEGDK